MASRILSAFRSLAGVFRRPAPPVEPPEIGGREIIAEYLRSRANRWNRPISRRVDNHQRIGRDRVRDLQTGGPVVRRSERRPLAA